jgi:hypothetical protein
MDLDERTQEEVQRWLRKMGVYLGTFIGGGILAFAYSYYPLHSMKDRKIDHLEERLQEGDLRLSELERELRSTRSESDGQPDREAFYGLQEEVATAATLQAELEKKLDRAERKVRDLEKSRGSLRAQVAKLEKSRDELADELDMATAGGLAPIAVTPTAEGVGDPTANPSAESGAMILPSHEASGNLHDQSLASTEAMRAQTGGGDFWEASGRSRSPAPMLERGQDGAE